MAEFQNVMRNMARICAKYWPDHEEDCSEECPLYETWCFNMDCDFPKIDRKQQDMAKVEETVMQWAAEHPVVYPTWIEWLTDVGAIPKAISWDEPLVEAVYDAIQKHIPADIAQKLGIEPKC